MSTRLAILFLLCALSAYCQTGKNGSQSLSFMTDDFMHSMLRGPGRDKMETKLGCLLEKRLGVWKCDLRSLDHPVSDEWKDALAVYLRIDGVSDVGLWVEGRGRASPSRAAGEGILTDRSIFVGYDTNGFSFVYTVFSNRMYTLFDPGRLQKRLVFEKQDNAKRLFTELQNDGAAGKPSRPIPAVTEGRESDGWRKRNARMVGWFESTSPIPLALQKRDVEKLYLRINGLEKVFFLYGKSGRVCLDRALFDPPFEIKGCYLGQEFAYAFDGDSRVDLAYLPPLINEYYELYLATLDKNSNRAKTTSMYISQLDATNGKRILRWLDPTETPKKIVFARIPDANVPYERFALASEFSVWGGKAVWNDELKYAFQQFSPWITMTRDGVFFGDQPDLQKLLSEEGIYDLFASRVYYDFVMTNGVPKIHSQEDK
ncbi:MAG: hypothetical protein IKR48_05665 [Kiritimatiellae bacterium]|nr:hypothetical protein [Kiritimatiellia bacterium]